MNTVILFLLLFVTTALSATCPPNDEDRLKSIRATLPLPTGVIPISYNITLEPDLDKKNFSGNAIILLHVIQQTKTITLHARDLTITKNMIHMLPLQSAIVINTMDYNVQDQLATITFDKDLKGYYTLIFSSYTGKLSDTDMEGFYWANYKDKSGKDHPFATTQFEKHGARRAFPCFDEPHLKATFAIQLIRSEGYSSVSNEELYMTIYQKDKNKYKDYFRETEKMSTYLVAFIVSDYVGTVKQKGQRVYADKESIYNGEGAFAHQTGIDVIDKLENYTGIRYAFPKLDQVAIPDEYFAPGAMENWGLVTYKKSLLVYLYNNETTSSHEATVQVIAHELAHQWFGNLVTCKSWKYIWLNEGFANYFEYFIPIMLNWDMEGLFVFESVHRALKADSVKEITEMNNETAPSIINYQKAGSVIRMLSHIVTPDLFQKSLAHYLEKNAYEAVEPNHLYSAVQDILVAEGWTNLTGGVEVGKIMGTWDSLPGYPLLTVTRNYEKGTIELSQERFYTDNTTDPNSLWHIPLNHALEEKPDTLNYTHTTATDWLNVTSKTIENMPKDGWVLYNKQQTGYYRVMYDEKNWNLLADQLNVKDHTKIHTFNKAQLLDDIFTFASIKKVNYTTALNLTKYLKNEKEYIPIAVFLNHIKLLDSKLAFTSGRDDFKKYLTNLLSGSALQEVSMSETENELNTNQHLRVELMNWLCKLGHQECKTSTLNTFKGQTSISPTLQATVYCGAMRSGSQEDWDKLYQMYNETTSSLHRSRILTGLGCSENNDTIRGFLDEALNTNPSNTQAIDVVAAFTAVINSGDAGVNYGLTYMVANFSKLVNVKYNTILTTIAEKLSTNADVIQFEYLATTFPSQAPDINKAKEIIKANINWNKIHGSTFKEWFSAYASTIDNGDSDGGGDGATSITFAFSLKVLLTTICLYVTTNIII